MPGYHPSDYGRELWIMNEPIDGADLDLWSNVAALGTELYTRSKNERWHRAAT